MTIHPRCIAFSVAMLFASQFAHANLVTNGDFSTLSPGVNYQWGYGWDFTPAKQNSVLSFERGHVDFGAGSTFDDEICQVLATTVGQLYHVSFSLESGAGFANIARNHFVGMFGSDAFYSETDTRHDLLNFDFTLLATSAETTLAFYGANIYGFNKLSNISVMAEPVPEPETWALMGLGMVGLLARYGRKSANQAKAALN